MFSRLFGKKNQAQNSVSIEQQPQDNPQEKATKAMVDIRNQIKELETKYFIDTCFILKGSAKERE